MSISNLFYVPKGYSSEIIAKSRAPNGSTITTYRIRYPRIILAEVNTHKVLCKSTSSSRAIPAKRMRAQVIRQPVVPIYWGANRPGMQAAQELEGWRLTIARQVWLKLRYLACASHWLLEKVGLHKQTCNRIIEPWMSTTTVITGVNWDNFFALRNHPSAQPEFRALAAMMQSQYTDTPAKQLNEGDWHIPFDPALDSQTYDLRTRLLCSAASCARTSYDNHDGTKPTLDKNLTLARSLYEAQPPHMSPFEHQAQCKNDDTWYANYEGWVQQRWFLERGLSVD